MLFGCGWGQVLKSKNSFIVEASRAKLFKNTLKLGGGKVPMIIQGFLDLQ